MMRALLLTCLLMWAAVAHANDWWDSLWRNADQRGEQLMQQGKAAAAARTFTDPRRKAYAELQAGDYQAAARDFTSYNDTTSNYNRGNALAMAGQLPAAIKAYDAALASDPKNADAKHNRDLVTQALQKQPPQSNSSAGKKPESGNDKDSQQNKSDGNQNNSQQKSAGNNPSPSAANKPQAQPKPGNDKSGNTQQPAQAHPQPAKPSGSSAAQNAPQPSPNPQQSSPQAAQQAQSSADKPQIAGKSSPTSGTVMPGKEKPAARNLAASADAPTTERQLAEDQWLKSIPDDPGGLLRRKFMIEHLMRQQGISP